jgi:hypothetical protein
LGCDTPSPVAVPRALGQRHPARPPPPPHPARRPAQRHCRPSTPHRRSQAACPDPASRSPVPSRATSSPTPMAGKCTRAGHCAAAWRAHERVGHTLLPSERMGRPPRRCCTASMRACGQAGHRTASTLPLGARVGRQVVPPLPGAWSERVEPRACCGVLKSTWPVPSQR